jgi:hypothetical protein
MSNIERIIGIQYSYINYLAIQIKPEVSTQGLSSASPRIAATGSSKDQRLHGGYVQYQMA